jgi:hypothetical protein
LKVIEEAKTIITNTIICNVCGGAGHISSDCKLRNSATAGAEKILTWAEREKMDTEVSFYGNFFWHYFYIYIFLSTCL